MNRMIVQCHPDGRIEHTLKDGLFNPAPTQKRIVDRLSLIEFATDVQGFYVLWLKGPYRNQRLDLWLWHNTVGEVGRVVPLKVKCLGRADVLYFDTYEAAVAAEIAVVEKLERGQTFA